ncbi:MAG: hypothetical protein V4664_00530 [Patescibacteria group bacterium]
MQKQNGYIEKLRAKPLAYRRMYAFLVSLFITMLILGAWSVSIASRLMSSDKNESMSASVSSSLSVLSLIKNQFAEVVDKNPFKEGSISTTSEQAGQESNILVQ